MPMVRLRISTSVSLMQGIGLSTSIGLSGASKTSARIGWLLETFLEADENLEVLAALVEQGFEALRHHIIGGNLGGDDFLDGEVARFHHADDARPALHRIAPCGFERNVLERPPHGINAGGFQVQPRLHYLALAAHGGNASVKAGFQAD